MANRNLSPPAPRPRRPRASTQLPSVASEIQPISADHHPASTIAGQLIQPRAPPERHHPASTIPIAGQLVQSRAPPERPRRKSAGGLGLQAPILPNTKKGARSEPLQIEPLHASLRQPTLGLVALTEPDLSSYRRREDGAPTQRPRSASPPVDNTTHAQWQAENTNIERLGRMSLDPTEIEVLQQPEVQQPEAPQGSGEDVNVFSQDLSGELRKENRLRRRAENIRRNREFAEMMATKLRIGAHRRQDDGIEMEVQDSEDRVTRVTVEALEDGRLVERIYADDEDGNQVELEERNTFGVINNGLVDRPVEDETEEYIERMLREFGEAFDDDAGDQPMAPPTVRYDPTAFNYTGKNNLTMSELCSLALFQAKTAGNVSRAVHSRYTRIMAAARPDCPPKDIRTVYNLLETSTGIAPQRFDVCRESCICYAGHPDATECPVCALPRLRPDGKPWKTFDYIPVTHQLVLQYSDANRAKEFLGHVDELYNTSGGRTEETHTIRDFWDGELANELRRRGMLKRRDLAFYFSTDGVRLFKTGTFSAWPLLLLNLNLRPEIRFKQENVILVGLIPGPREPKDTNSFFRPLIDEFKVLSQGVEASDGSSKERFKLRAYITLVGGDMPAKSTYARDALISIMTYWIVDVYCAPSQDDGDDGRKQQLLLLVLHGQRL